MTGSYRYVRTLSKPEPAARLVRLAVARSGKPSRTLAAVLAEGGAIGRGMNLARELGNTPPNICTPRHLAEQARALARRYPKLRCRVLDEKQMLALGMHSLLSVTAGAQEPARLIVLDYRGAAREEQPFALVGKGVTFDSGGISLKPPAGMWDMKWDMGGAGVVIGLMRALARRKAPVNVVGLCGLVENMPDGKAQRPGDVVTSMSGQTIEVLNTDAEGRLVLADVLWYAQRFKPKAIVDLATLTGAIIQTLSEHYAGLFSNNDELAAKLLAAGQAVSERLWRLPMGEEYDRDIKSPIADMKNIGGGRAGSITAAQFLLRFIKDVPWAHLDIAGVVWNDKATALAPGGGTGYGVRLLNRFIADNYEK